MPIWLRKSLVVIISIATLGIVTPAQATDLFTQWQEKNNKPDTFNSLEYEPAGQQLDEEEPRKKFVERAMKDAEDLSFEKFGSKIGPVIENEFRQVILPGIETAIQSVVLQHPEDSLDHLIISESPGGGTSEKIFNISGADGKDLIRFHVRRDQPPQQGYWFNFHYHTHHDGFQEHFKLGTIFWAKNTPPQWKS
ncbi:YpjP family protein [Bacillus sp. T33-2]|uniref:YpjP family protein n=1 Tax=Bacillus sp. T33-2 TaxID=2054168 RepID=UPI000C773CDE|nr:YpjP family protein [Bacillus sp. T33-2]PLR98908.1 hypothetical protein CVD19_04575 [Bacillus sp. T33-2]